MDRNELLVSVIIPCYNVSPFVEKSIQSILNQTYRNLEIWIIDDASTDDTLEKIKKNKDERIRLISLKENTQKVGAVNEVLQKVNGEYIAFQDADDWSEPTRIEEELKLLQKDSLLGICFTNYRCIKDEIFSPKKIPISNAELRNEFLNFNYQPKSEISPTICGTMMISKAALQKTKGYHPYFAGRVAEDIHWVYRILKEFNGATVDKVLYNYRKREGSFTDNQSKGLNAKYAYSWQLVSKIIYKDIHERVDVLAPENTDLLQKLELQACEEALLEKIIEVNKITKAFKNSSSYKLGKFILSPSRGFNRISGKK